MIGEKLKQHAPVAAGLVLHLLAEGLVLDGPKEHAAELGVLLLDDERLVDEAGRDGFDREGVEVVRLPAVPRAMSDVFKVRRRRRVRRRPAQSAPAQKCAGAGAEVRRFEPDCSSPS